MRLVKQFKHKNNLNDNDEYVLISESGDVVQHFSEKDEDPFLSKDVKMIPHSNCFEEEVEDGMMSLVIGTEIRKDSIWEIQIKFDTKLFERHAVTNFVLLNHKKNIKLKKFEESEYYIDLKVRSKLLRDPIRELPFEKVGVVMNESDCVDVHKDSASVRVKFTKRPRSVFHKQSDMMILVVTLNKGSKRICSTAQELIFRGGTGSVHSAEKKKKSRKNFKPETNNNLEPENPYLTMIAQQQNFAPEPFSNIPNLTYYPVETIESVDNNMSYPVNGENNYSYPVNGENNFSYPVNGDNNFSNTRYYYDSQPIHQEIELDPKSFLEDFWANKGNFLPGFETLEKPPFIGSGNEYSIENNQSELFNQYDSPSLTQSNTDDISNSQLIQQDTTSIDNSSPLTTGFSFSVNGSSFKDGKFQALIEGIFLDKAFSGTLIGSIDPEGFQGSFNSKFTQINSSM